MEYAEIKRYTKKELALLYFPDSSPETANKHLMRWIKRNKHLMQKLEEINYKPNERWFTKQEVEIIFRYIGPPWFFDNRRASLCYAKTKGKGRKTKDGWLPEIWNYGNMESRIHEDFAALQLTARRTKDKGRRTKGRAVASSLLTVLCLLSFAFRHQSAKRKRSIINHSRKSLETTKERVSWNRFYTY